MKPIVTYSTVLLPVEVGYSAFALDIVGHPGLPTIDSETGERGNYARTSAVESVKLDEHGEVVEFETLNTIYRKRI